MAGGNSKGLSALIVVSIYNYHREVLPVVERLAAHGWRVEILLGWRGSHADAAHDAYSALGCRVHAVVEAFAYIVAGTTTGQVHSGATSVTRVPTLTRLRVLLGTLRAAVRLRRRMGALLDRLSPDVVMFGPFHSCGRFDNALLAAAIKRHIPTACYPVSAYHGRTSAIKARISNLNAGMLAPALAANYDWINRLAACVFPHWTQTHNGQTIFMWDPMIMIAAKLAGLMERDVWHKPSVRFDRVFVYNSFSRELLAGSGYPMGGVRIVGVPLLDPACAAASDATRRNNTFTELGLAVDQPFLLFNVEPSAEHHYLDWSKHWHNFEAMMRVAVATELPVVLSLHPLCRMEDYLFAEEKFGVRIARRHKIHDLYPLCRLVLSFPCSTNVFAEIFGKPLVIYDFFGLAAVDSDRAHEFRLPGALVGHNPLEVSAHLRSVLDRPMDAQDWKPPPLACVAIETCLRELVSASFNASSRRPASADFCQSGPVQTPLDRGGEN